MSKVEEVTAMHESDPNFKNIKSLAEIPDSDKQDLRSANPIDRLSKIDGEKSLLNYYCWEKKKYKL